MRWMHPTRYALGLTAGSIRAILALLLVIATIAALLRSLEHGELNAGAAALVVLTQAVVRDYFDNRRQGSDPMEPSDNGA